MAGQEVGEGALHEVDEEANGGESALGFRLDDVGELGADEVIGVVGRGLWLASARALGVGLVDEWLSLMEAEFDEGRAEERRWEDSKWGSWSFMAETKKRTMRRPSWVSWAMMSARMDIYSNDNDSAQSGSMEQLTQ